MIRSTPQAIEIYSAYPRRVKKPAALRAILNAIERDGFEKVRDATQAYAKRVQEVGRELQFVPYPATFFNGEMYNDDLDALLPKVNGHKISPAMRLKAVEHQLAENRKKTPDLPTRCLVTEAEFNRAIERRRPFIEERKKLLAKIGEIQKEML